MDQQVTAVRPQIHLHISNMHCVSGKPRAFPYASFCYLRIIYHYSSAEPVHSIAARIPDTR
jgi:hypothetical protein